MFPPHSSINKFIDHVGHHIVRGTGNYNIVFPGPDYWFGTAFYPSGETAESMQ